jgi:ribosome-binding protein aMBF1 (putative translation factor)
MRTKTKAENYNSPEIDGIFSEISETEMHQTKNRMLVAKQIADALKRKGWQKKEFARMMGKRPSEITRWLSGTHNFTMDTLSDLEPILGIKLLNIDAEVKSARFSYSTSVEIKTLRIQYKDIFENLQNYLNENITVGIENKPIRSTNFHYIN